MWYVLWQRAEKRTAQVLFKTRLKLMALWRLSRYRFGVTDSFMYPGKRLSPKQAWGGNPRRDFIVVWLPTTRLQKFDRIAKITRM